MIPTRKQDGAVYPHFPGKELRHEERAATLILWTGSEGPLRARVRVQPPHYKPEGKATRVSVLLFPLTILFPQISAQVSPREAPEPGLTAETPFPPLAVSLGWT